MRLPKLHRLHLNKRLFPGLLALAVIWGGCATQRANNTSAQGLWHDATPRLPIISAFEPELKKLRAATQPTGARVLNGRYRHLPDSARSREVGYWVDLSACASESIQ
jgi:hypothetical protein